ncbi:hypothetical protein OG909_09280 [Streptomyces sp. NBC_01754]|uniref:hypothetical protein n=1 Tax=Streptomyces sp. NBC_01754 TaxID=2975930 RepID=UPI002DD8E117|nr:hypothetical protein [Streptomyces sp. NBC_01754]WSC92468.1 hypothetical protein OG909_09280 [Streptomyces sp. NBC_01754]
MREFVIDLVDATRDVVELDVHAHPASRHRRVAGHREADHTVQLVYASTRHPKDTDS